MKDERFFADALLPANNDSAGFLCWTCTQIEGIRPGWGRAQFYRWVLDELKPASPALGRWLCFAGGPSVAAITTEYEAEFDK